MNVSETAMPLFPCLVGRLHAFPGSRFRFHSQIASSRSQIICDLTAPESFFTEHGLKALFQPGERLTRNNVHGLMVYPSEPKTQFVAWGPHSLLRGITVETF